MVWPDGTTFGSALPCPYHFSKGAEFRAFVQTVRYLQSIGVCGSVFCCVHSSQVMQNVDAYLSNNPQGLASRTTQSTWQQILCDLIDRSAFNLGIGWLKAHVGFPGNEMADALAKYCSYALRVQDCHRQPPSHLSITIAGNPVVHKFSGSQRRALYPGHQRTCIRKPTRFDWSTHYFWFSSFADKWVMGFQGVAGAAPHFDLADRQCPDCNKQHPFDITLCIAICEEFRALLLRMADSWNPTLAPPVHAWLQSNLTRGELLNFARTLVSTSLCETLAPDRESSRLAKDVLPSRRNCLSAICKQACSDREEHPLWDPLPCPLTANHFYDAHGAFSTSDRTPPTNFESRTPPSCIPLQVRRKPPATAPKRKAPRAEQQNKRKECHKSSSGPGLPDSLQ